MGFINTKATKVDALTVWGMGSLTPTSINDEIQFPAPRELVGSSVGGFVEFFVPTAAGGENTVIAIRQWYADSSPPASPYSWHTYPSVPTIWVKTHGLVHISDPVQGRIRLDAQVRDLFIKAINGVVDSRVIFPGSGAGSAGISGVTASIGTDDKEPVKNWDDKWYPGNDHFQTRITLTATTKGVPGNSICYYGDFGYKNGMVIPTPQTPSGLPWTMNNRSWKDKGYGHLLAGGKKNVVERVYSGSITKVTTAQTIGTDDDNNSFSDSRQGINLQSYDDIFDSLFSKVRINSPAKRTVSGRVLQDTNFDDSFSTSFFIDENASTAKLYVAIGEFWSRLGRYSLSKRINTLVTRNDWHNQRFWIKDPFGLKQYFKVLAGPPDRFAQLYGPTPGDTHQLDPNGNYFNSINKTVYNTGDVDEAGNRIIQLGWGPFFLSSSAVSEKDNTYNAGVLAPARRTLVSQDYLISQQAFPEPYNSKIEPNNEYIINTIAKAINEAAKETLTDERIDNFFTSGINDNDDGQARSLHFSGSLDRKWSVGAKVHRRKSGSPVTAPDAYIELFSTHPGTIGNEASMGFDEDHHAFIHGSTRSHILNHSGSPDLSGPVSDPVLRFYSAPPTIANSYTPEDPTLGSLSFSGGRGSKLVLNRHNSDVSITGKGRTSETFQHSLEEQDLGQSTLYNNGKPFVDEYDISTRTTDGSFYMFRQNGQRIREPDPARPGYSRNKMGNTQTSILTHTEFPAWLAEINSVSSHSGVIDVFDIRSKIDRTSLESPFHSKGIKGTVGQIEDHYQRSSQVVEGTDLGVEPVSEHFLDAPEGFYGISSSTSGSVEDGAPVNTGIVISTGSLAKGLAFAVSPPPTIQTNVFAKIKPFTDSFFDFEKVYNPSTLDAEMRFAVLGFKFGSSGSGDYSSPVGFTKTDENGNLLDTVVMPYKHFHLQGGYRVYDKMPSTGYQYDNDSVGVDSIAFGGLLK